MEITLSDGETVELEGGSGGIELARKLKKKLEGPAIALRVNGELRDLKTALRNRDEVQVLTFSDPDGQDIFWHSSAHLLAQAVLRLYPDAQPTIGPSIESGFYYDFANLSITEAEFPRIEDEMAKIVKERFEPRRIEYKSKDEALKEFNGNPFKTELIESQSATISAYQQGEFTDLCLGPHLPHTGLIQAFKVMKTSGAYWRADAANEQLTRVYAISFPDKKQLSAHLRFLEEAKKRDHRVVGRQLDLFSFHIEAPGMPFFHPKGMIIWDELMKYWEEEHKKAGYTKIKTPVMLSQELWEKSGHWENYRENMYVSEIEEKAFIIKPMNCPGGMLFYKEHQYSYKQLPMRVAEIGNVHRHEMSGALSGLFRVRSFHQDDAHIFMKPVDISSEIKNVLDLSARMYQVFGLEYHLELSTRPEKSIGNDQQWNEATKGLKDALDSGGYDYVINEGDGAFYGPKIDMHIRDAIGRTWQCGTVQLDMMLPERFDLSYITDDGSKKRPVMIHRVVYGSIERFFGVLVEHFAGKFPLWLSPVQLRILPVNENHIAYAEKINQLFDKAGLRGEVDHTSESISKKVRLAQLDQVNYIMVVGEKELEADTVTVRASNQVLGAYSPLQVIKSLQKEIKDRLPRQNQIQRD
ncbi:MAG: threonine--tRNA ligase [Deltaproteobacteria bacterium]|nr:threonine--tRNA ligase [Deltaproteobacteria bacterium]